MELSKTELSILKEIAKGNKSVKNIASGLDKSKKTIYSSVENLKDFVDLRNGSLKAKRFLHVSLLLQILSNYIKIIPVLANSGIPILTSILDSNNIQRIIEKTGFKKTIIYSKLKEARKKNIVIKTQQGFKLNRNIWKSLVDFLISLKDYENHIDKRIPPGSRIYHKNNQEIVFSSKEDLDAKQTAFSAYPNYGIDILTVKNYYYLPKRDLTKEDILKHSLYILEKDFDTKYLIFTALFYAKFRKSFSINHEILIKIDKVLNKEKVEGYPAYSEIKDRAEIYNIKI